MCAQNRNSVMLWYKRVNFSQTIFDTNNITGTNTIIGDDFNINVLQNSVPSTRLSQYTKSAGFK